MLASILGLDVLRKERIVYRVEKLTVTPFLSPSFDTLTLTAICMLNSVHFQIIFSRLKQSSQMDM